MLRKKTLFLRTVKWIITILVSAFLLQLTVPSIELLINDDVTVEIDFFDSEEEESEEETEETIDDKEDNILYSHLLIAKGSIENLKALRPSVIPPLQFMEVPTPPPDITC